MKVEGDFTPSQSVKIVTEVLKYAGVDPAWVLTGFVKTSGQSPDKVQVRWEGFTQIDKIEFERIVDEIRANS